MGGISRLLRAEGLAVAIAMAAWLWQAGVDWRLLVVVLIAPDLSLAGYALGPKRGALIYNAVHSYVGPGLMAAVALVSGQAIWVQVAAIWVLHIGIDRALGYGLKLPGGFGETHLGRIGRGG